MALLLKHRATLVLAIALAAAGCDNPMTDPAERIAAAVRDGAARLNRSPSDTLVLSVVLRSWPRGCPDEYRVEWRADTDRLPGLGVICGFGATGFASIAYRDVVSVPKALQVTKAKGEPATIALRKRTGGAIEVVALQ